MSKFQLNMLITYIWKLFGAIEGVSKWGIIVQYSIYNVENMKSGSFELVVVYKMAIK